LNQQSFLIPLRKKWKGKKWKEDSKTAFLVNKVKKLLLVLNMKGRKSSLPSYFISADTNESKLWSDSCCIHFGAGMSGV